MSVRRFVRFIAGTVVSLGFLAGWFIHEYFYFIVLFAGLNLLQSSFTGFCPPEIFYNKFIK